MKRTSAAIPLLLLAAWAGYGLLAQTRASGGGPVLPAAEAERLLRAWARWLPGDLRSLGLTPSPRGPLYYKYRVDGTESTVKVSALSGRMFSWYTPWDDETEGQQRVAAEERRRVQDDFRRRWFPDHPGEVLVTGAWGWSGFRADDRTGTGRYVHLSLDRQGRHVDGATEYRGCYDRVEVKVSATQAADRVAAVVASSAGMRRCLLPTLTSTLVGLPAEYQSAPDYWMDDLGVGRLCYAYLAYAVPANVSDAQLPAKPDPGELSWLVPHGVVLVDANTGEAVASRLEDEETLWLRTVDGEPAVDTCLGERPVRVAYPPLERDGHVFFCATECTAPLWSATISRDGPETIVVCQSRRARANDNGLMTLSVPLKGDATYQGFYRGGRLYMPAEAFAALTDQEVRYDAVSKRVSLRVVETKGLVLGPGAN